MMTGTTVVSTVAGVLFGIGLAVSGMFDPARVLGFLDIAGLADGTWDPSLALVMIGALAVTLPAFAWSRRRAGPVAAPAFQQATVSGIEPRLLAGSALFGIGWGLVGYCPGPALAAMGFGQPTNLVFVAAMIAGMALHRWAFGAR